MCTTGTRLFRRAERELAGPQPLLGTDPKGQHNSNTRRVYRIHSYDLGHVGYLPVLGYLETLRADTDAFDVKPPSASPVSAAGLHCGRVKLDDKPTADLFQAGRLLCSSFLGFIQGRFRL